MDQLVQMHQSVEPLRYVRGADQSADFLTHTHSIFSQAAAAPRISQPETAGLGEAVGVCVCVCVLGLVSGWVSLCLAKPTQQPRNHTSKPAHTVRSSQQRASQRPANTAPRPHAAFSSVCHCWCYFLVANAIETHNH